MTEITSVLGVTLPDGIKILVHAWRWEGAGADSASLSAYKIIHAELARLDRNDQSIGVYRTRVADQRDLGRYLFVVDVNFDLLERSEIVRNGLGPDSWLGGEIIDPPQHMAQSLTLRHIKQALIPAISAEDGKVNRKAHYGLGLLVDQFGDGSAVVGEG